jgi:hypothetical protein
MVTVSVERISMVTVSAGRISMVTASEQRIAVVYCSIIMSQHWFILGCVTFTAVAIITCLMISVILTGVSDLI